MAEHRAPPQHYRITATLRVAARRHPCRHRPRCALRALSARQRGRDGRVRQPAGQRVSVRVVSLDVLPWPTRVLMAEGGCRHWSRAAVKGAEFGRKRWSPRKSRARRRATARYEPQRTRRRSFTLDCRGTTQPWHGVRGCFYPAPLPRGERISFAYMLQADALFVTNQ